MSSEMSLLVLCGFVAMASILMAAQVFLIARIFHVPHHTAGRPWPRSISM